MINSRDKGTFFSENPKFSFQGKIIDFSSPKVMGILNITPDSFYAGSRFSEESQILEKAGNMIEEGAYILDIGGYSTRPGAADVSQEVETERILRALRPIRQKFPGLIISVDTYRSEIARIGLEEGADIINDISGGNFDPLMVPFVAGKQVPYIIMHIQGSPANMQIDPHYEDVVEEVRGFLKGRLKELNDLGHQQVIIDPGFGFGKNVEHNFQLLDELDKFCELGVPVLAGLSRKSMINKILGTIPAKALNGTTVLNTIALLKGASLLRVHDVRPAVEAVKLVGALPK